MNIPENCAICPVCHGEKQVPIQDHQKNWYPGKTHHECSNCGGQTMYGQARGYVPVDPGTGLGCRHEYSVQELGRCYRKYTCKKCKYGFDIDSGD